MLGWLGFIFIIIVLIAGAKENLQVNKQAQRNTAIFNEKKSKALKIIMTQLNCNRETAEEIMHHETVYNEKRYRTYFFPLGKYDSFALFENGNIIAKF